MLLLKLTYYFSDIAYKITPSLFSVSYVFVVIYIVQEVTGNQSLPSYVPRGTSLSKSQNTQKDYKI